jgi:hypothetical protein
MRGLGNWSPVIFFIFVVVLGNFILLKLFLAILIINFGEASKENAAKLSLEAKNKKTIGMINFEI